MRKPSINNQIRAEQVRLVDETGHQVGIVALQEALRLARERNLDLIQVTERVEPPVCRIMEYGKYLYSLQKKERVAKAHHHGGEMKGIRLTFNISVHDMEVRARLAEKFLNMGDKVRVEMVLRGRERGLENFAREKMKKFIEMLGNKLSVKIERELKREARGLTMIISKS